MVSEVKMNVKIYTKEGCPYCVRAKDFFNKKNIKVQEVTEREISKDTFYTLTGMKTWPAIYIDGKLIGGYTDLIKHVAENSDKF